jgi:hypothetical protein
MTNINRNSSTRFPARPEAAANAADLKAPDRPNLEQDSPDLATAMAEELAEQALFAVAAEPNFSGLRW